MDRITKTYVSANYIISTEDDVRVISVVDDNTAENLNVGDNLDIANSFIKGDPTVINTYRFVGKVHKILENKRIRIVTDTQDTLRLEIFVYAKGTMEESYVDIED